MKRIANDRAEFLKRASCLIDPRLLSLLDGAVLDAAGLDVSSLTEAYTPVNRRFQRNGKCNGGGDDEDYIKMIHLSSSEGSQHKVTGQWSSL